MKLKYVIFVMALAAMGPARDAPPPDTDVVRNPARLPPVSAPVPTAPDATTSLSRHLDATEARPGDFLWNARPVVVFADTPDDPAFTEQMRALQRDAAALAARDVVVITDTDPAADSLWRQQLRPRGFSLVVIDKDGQVKIRRPSPWDAREIGRAIDRLPLRRQEIGRGSVLPLR
ncbi:DUF4174 domain-containing protein [Paracoccus sp. (in: a-proteobacteria)]|uniref:DUF4174 domain-containing protein n=1 Tax=Paracoccus sp. TaxID=267 RepID=UPI0026E0572C|nr:DUF4174 domain-containing protein [Paracoccus sp. (in: a-proteobacteria)]MDO5647652.1 DUF4174 domain-containing protein [Paracoccus sp. (in: a-proteobacteria)]